MELELKKISFQNGNNTATEQSELLH